MAMLQRMPAPQFEHIVGVFWSGGDPDIIDGLTKAGCEIVCLDKHRGIDMGFQRRLNRLVKTRSFDVMHAWLMSSGLWGRLAEMMTRRRVPTVVSFRSSEVHTWPGGVGLDRFLDRYADVYICNSLRVRDVWAERLKSDGSDMIVIDNGVDCQKFRPGDQTAMRTALGIDADALVICAVGSMKPAKNWPMFLEVASKVTTGNPKAVFLGIGGGPMLDEMRNRLNELGDADGRIRLLGDRTDVADILRASDLLLSTSVVEGMSNAILEGMASGLPVVATRISGSEELVRHDQTGYLCQSRNLDDAVDRVEAILTDPTLALQMSRAARQVAQEAYSFEQMADGHAKAYCRAIAARQGK
ncbi:hypothetical protein LCGC14_0181310 [marine sediment metagenome]|uniref:Glycosyltransferase subfamily 4-like N-terminal domain-containing protein n=1 Tax=marine sediment metagenome TaxID=412755 RepID=A0A0F9XS30_9ZZZZ